MDFSNNTVLTTPPVLSVALSVLNGGPSLYLAVASLQMQTFTNWELLLIDDGSTDGAIERLPFLSDPRIHVLRDGLKKGLSTRLNQAIDMARGKYFARMDHDDICHPDRFLKQISFLDHHPEIDLLSSRCITMDEAERITGALPFAIFHSDICSRPWQGFYMPHPSWVGRIEWFRRHRYPEPAPYCCEDQELLLRASTLSRYHCLPISLLAYRVRTCTPWRKLWRTRISLAQVQINHFLGGRRYVQAILACATAFLRLCRDAMGRLRITQFFVRQSSITPEEVLAWNELISSLKDGSKFIVIKPRS